MHMSRAVLAERPTADCWYATAACDDGIVHLREAWLDPYLTGDMWLIRGRNRDLLVDCGTGIVPPRSTVESISRNPVIAVACNCWYDHAGGLHDFAERGCHRDDAAAIAAPTADSSVASIYVSDEMLIAGPHPGYSVDSYRMVGTTPTILFEDEDSIDLGDREIVVIHVPGMTPGSIALWEEATGSLFTSDTLFDDPSPELRMKYRPISRPPDPQRRAVRVANLKRLNALRVKTVYAGHFGRISRDRMLELISAEIS
jgi:glyoxylase-like metal-dependent hydrolase (beta-lactamase superfamily II)